MRVPALPVLITQFSVNNRERPGHQPNLVFLRAQFAYVPCDKTNAHSYMLYATERALLSVSIRLHAHALAGLVHHFSCKIRRSAWQRRTRVRE